MINWIENEFDKVMKEFTGDDEKVEPEDVSGEELVAEENRRVAEEKERKARQEKIKKEREEVRQKIRDKYHIKNKDEPLPITKKHEHNKVDDSTTRVHSPTVKLEKSSEPEPQGFDPLKMTNDAFNNIKRKFGWK